MALEYSLRNHVEYYKTATNLCVFRAAVEFCRGKCSHLRVDTHEDNKPMQHLAQKYGFSRRGIIYVEDGTPRIAYDLI